MTEAYVHGYTLRESVRLQDQAATLVELLHGDTVYAPGSRVLEAGCGVGAQTLTLAQNSPGAHITSVDLSAESLGQAQRQAGGNALVGRQLHPLLVAAGFQAVRVSPRMVYVDATRPDLVEGFIKKTFTAMIEGVRAPAVGSGMIEPETFEAGLRALYRTAEPDGVFCYTFFKAVGVKAEGAAPGRAGDAGVRPMVIRTGRPRP